MSATVEKIINEVRSLSVQERAEFFRVLDEDRLEQRRRAARELHGKYPLRPDSVDDFLARKHEETQREEELWEQRQREREGRSRE